MMIRETLLSKTITPHENDATEAIHNEVITKLKRFAEEMGEESYFNDNVIKACAKDIVDEITFRFEIARKLVTEVYGNTEPIVYNVSLLADSNTLKIGPSEVALSIQSLEMALAYMEKVEE